MASGGGDFMNGSAVEVSSNEDGFRGAWYEGTIIRPITTNTKKKLLLVEYKTLISDKNPKTKLRESVDPLHLRPLPPPEKKRKRRRFDISQEVDAWYSDGWWEGVITGEVVSREKYSVFFRGTREQIVFPSTDLRVHREWTKGTWLPPFQEEEEEEDDDNEKKQNVVFGEEMLVEVSSDEEGFQGAWFAATIIKRVNNGERYLIEYKTLRNDNDTDFLREEADVSHIRPYPPDMVMIDRFNLHEEIDALYNDGWWVGVISKVLNDERYVVYFRGTDEEIKFNHSELRIHQEWIDGTWVVSSHGLNVNLNIRSTKRKHM